MARIILLLFFVVSSVQVFCQQKLEKLTVEKIMRDPKWIGTSPSNPAWSNDGTTLYFSWNPDKAPNDSLYYITLSSRVPVKASVVQKQGFVSPNAYVYNNARTAYAYAREGDIFYTDIKTNTTRRITQTVDPETNPQFSFNQTKIVYNRRPNLYAWDIITGETMQLTNIRAGEAPAQPQQTGGFQRGGGGNFQGRGGTSGNANQQEDWLKNDQLQTFDVLRSRKEKTDLATAYNTSNRRKEMRSS